MAFKDKEQITIFLTTACNLACYYCYMPKMHVEPQHRFVDVRFAKRAISDFFASSESRTIRFFGAGEPTLAFDSMREIYDFARSIGGDALRVELETNGFFGNTVADWVERHVNYLWFSFDGPPDIQDRQRPASTGGISSAVVLENITRFVAAPLQFGARATIAKAEIPNQVGLIDYFHSLGISYVAASPTYYSKVNPSIVTPSLLEFASYFVPAYYHAIDLGMFYQTLLTVNFDGPTDIYCQAHLPSPRITTDGHVSCCDWASLGERYLPHPVKQELIYGRYDQETDHIVYDENKMRRIRQRNVSYLGAHFCAGCEALHHCAGGCVGKMAAATGSLYEATQDWCEAVRYLFRHLPRDRKTPVLHP